MSPESAEIMAKLGFGLLVIMQNEWPKAAEDIQRYRDITASVGHAPRPPIISTNISVAESREEAHERAAQYLARKWDSIDAHYHFSDGHLATVKGYEFYGRHGQDLLEDEGRELPQEGHRVLRQDPGRSARPTTACSRSPSCTR